MTTKQLPASALPTFINSDVILSVANHILAFAAAWLIGQGWDTGTLDFVQGCAMAVISFAISWWQNSEGTVLDMVQSMLRRIMTLFSGFAVQRGWLTSETMAVLMQAAPALFAMLWSVAFNRSAPGPSLPGTTVIDGQ